MSLDANTSIISVRDIYYAALPSIDGLPGVRIYQSKDLEQWEYYTDIVTDQGEWNGSPNLNPCTPQLSYHDHQFYLIYSDLKSSTRPSLDCESYLMVADRLEGPWSEPICLHSNGLALSSW
ncbi:family 43 glycosylhydrolase [Paenibacillus bouchesdurhonensis]|uniref:family 43 glycosylhydrolase n=1 Tax=Paenibacillus bouchesdurhonensis TaxID=1870990 RepID=UPI000DA63AA8|nr:family 43 glycosylhydrolase [Paenibacillus bouchesdurhonensis]